MSIPQPRIILASGSPRRRELLEEAGYKFVVVPPAEDVECGVCSEFGPAGLVADLAYRKAAAVGKTLSGNSAGVGLAADTVAECDAFVLGKRRDALDARAVLTELSGREHLRLT